MEREKWKLEDVRVSNLDLGSAKYGTLQRYEVRIRIGKSKLVFKLWDQVSRWKIFKKAVVGDFESLANKVSSKAVLDVLQIEGPFELRVAGDDDPSLMLPVLSLFIIHAPFCLFFVLTVCPCLLIGLRKYVNESLKSLIRY